MLFKPKILIVEDDTAMLRLLGEVVGKMGAEPHCLTSSRHAAELIEREKFDGIFLDWRMPEMDGLELARRIRRSRSNGKVPLVMLTGVTKPHALQESFGVGIDFFLQKPVSVQQVRNLLNAARGSMLEERRRYQRAPVSLRMHCQWDGHRGYAQTVNLSASGALLEMDNPPGVNTRVKLELELPGHPKPLQLGGSVVRLVAGRGLAVRFDYRQPEHHQEVMEFVDKTLARLGGPSDEGPSLPI